MLPEKEITSYDIAQQLNISAATVSRGLKDHLTVNKSTRKTIQDIARQVGYRSYTSSTSLPHNSSNTIVVTHPRLNSFLLYKVLDSLDQMAY